MTSTFGNALPAGTRLEGGKFVIESCLGQGGFGITYRAEEMALRRTVAIKEFFPSACTRTASRLAPAGGWTQGSLDAFKSKFLEEGQMLARLRNAGIPHVYGVFEENGTAYLVMEYVEGRTLDAYLTSKGGRLSVQEALVTICKAGEALQVVHAAKLIHRDIKPSNLMLRSDGQVVLIDFGAAREFVPDAVYSQSQTVILTPGYAPLEQYSREGMRGPFTDVYALAATLYHLLTGRRPVEATDRASGVPLQAPHAIDPSIPRGLSDAVMNGLEVRAQDRPTTVVKFCAMILQGRVVNQNVADHANRRKREAPNAARTVSRRRVYRRAVISAALVAATWLAVMHFIGGKAPISIPGAQPSSATNLIDKVRDLEGPTGAAIQKAAKREAKGRTSGARTLSEDTLHEISIQAAQTAYHDQLNKEEYRLVFPAGRSWNDYVNIFDGPGGAQTPWLANVYKAAEEASATQAELYKSANEHLKE